MDMYFLNEDFSILDGPIEEFTSIVWSERYFEAGTFTLHFPRSLFDRASRAVYVKSTAEDGGIICGRVEYLITDDGDCEMGGHLLEIMLSDRVISGRGRYIGTVSEAVQSAVIANLRGCGISVAEDSAEISESAALSFEWDNLSDWLYSVLRPYGASYTVRLDSETNIPMFRIVRGQDRSTEGDAGEHRAVFSSSFGNITSLVFEKNSEEMKNVAYIEGSDGISVTVDKSGGGRKREIYKKAGDISPSGFSSTDEYMTALTRRGEELLAKYPEAVCVGAECDSEALPRYGIDYSLGDVCDVADDEFGLAFGLRLTAVDTVFENGRKSVHPSFGDEVRYVKKIRALK